MYKVTVGRIMYKDGLTAFEAKQIQKDLSRSVKGVKVVWYKGADE